MEAELVTNVIRCGYSDMFLTDIILSKGLTGHLNSSDQRGF